MIDNLEDAIAHAKEVARDMKLCCVECAEEHEQLVAWLTQLKTVKDIVREFNDDTLSFTYSSSDFITAIIKAVGEEEK